MTSKKASVSFSPKWPADARVVMNQDQGGFGRVFIERLAEPIQLFVAEQAGCGERCFE